MCPTAGHDTRLLSSTNMVQINEVTEVSLVLLAVVSKDQILQLDLNLDPLLICQCRPDMMRLRNGRLVWLEYHLRPIVVDVHCTQDQNEPTERRV